MINHSHFATPLTQILGCEYPILAAGMGGVARHKLAAAVSNAGGFGCLGMVRETPEFIRQEVLAYRTLSKRTFAVNIIPAATDKKLLSAQIKTCIDLQVPAITLFWDVDAEVVRRLKGAGIQVLHQVGNRKDAEQALALNVDVLIAQGIEAGGHVRDTIAMSTLVPELVSLTKKTPIVACGGITSGDGLVAALALGAQGICCGTLFLATEESNAHEYHKQRILASQAEDTIHSFRFHHNWPMKAAVRVLKNSVTSTTPKTDKNLTIIGEQDNQPIYLFSTDSPLVGATGDLEAMALYAGQGCGQIHRIETAATRVNHLMSQAERSLKQLTALPAS